MPARSATTAIRVLPITSEVEGFLEESYPSFRSLVRNNEKIWNATLDAEEGYTIFAPSEDAIAALGEEKLSHLRDDAELAHIVASYHFINELVTEEELSVAGGVVTQGGTLPVGQQTCGIFGLGGKECGVTINEANLVKSSEISNCIIHEVDSLVCPESVLQHLAVMTDLNNPTEDEDP
eukprot:CAMPEP_0197832858 /NCGR_PEP_ID=MMETSP1437-20131217/16494_1 /TAXON_ID=49252 ORGANISM="Eucampia antarctica, Strain CCMP1452" /NCGR_SAMPLE_ID=MMETSP1437 /ASSEMBLY_ACC=CAM_ASM_001096 /LENGTH=178 /DNA_ID=CAMNT_0043436479 /DNA_START=197 /DNA_END=733 /DNA_ORIENTATION=+